MSKKKEYQTLRVSEAPDNDVYRGWIRINRDDRKGYSRKDLILIEIEDNKSKLVRRVFGSNRKGHILMDFDTRYNNGKWNLRVGDWPKFRLTKINFLSFRRIIYYLNHPNDSIKISTRLSVASLAIAIITLLVTFRSAIAAFFECIMSAIQLLGF
jgi:hypothetical protein